MTDNQHLVYEFKDAVSYDSQRPDYTPENIEFVWNLMTLDEECDRKTEYDIVELGAGTGKFTSSISPYIKYPLRYLATEPVTEFLDALKHKLLNIPTARCTADSIPIPNESTKAVIIAQSFHWFATENVLREIHRVLIPNGIVVLIWYRMNSAGISWYTAIDNYLDNLMKKLGFFRPEWQLWRQPFYDNAHLFTPIEDYDFSGPSVDGDRYAVNKFFRTISAIKALEYAEQEKALADLDSMLPDGELHLGFHYDIAVCRKL